MPITVVWHAAGMAEVPAGDGWLSPAEAARVATMGYPKRRTEFRLGRWTAKTALAAVLGLPTGPADLARIEIRADPDGAPVPRLDAGPVPIAMSMTDRADWAVCALSARPVGLGCDLELVEPRSDLFVADYLTPRERRSVHAAGAPDLAANLLWSAKESALKVLRTGLRRDTRSVEVTLRDGLPEHPAGWVGLEVRDAEAGTVFPGWWRRFGDFVLTVATTEPTPPPEPLDGRERLLTARPSHGWWRAST